MDWVGTANLFITLGAAIVAYKAYLTNINDNRSKHVHELFREYLKLRVETKDPNEEEFTAFQLYVLEEIYAWIRKIRRTAKRTRWLMMPSTYRERRSFTDAWLKTIASHLRAEPDAVLKSLTLNEGCYGKSFVDFVRDSLNHKS